MEEHVKMVSTLSAVTVQKATKVIPVKLILMIAAPIHVRMKKPVKMMSTLAAVTVNKAT